MTSPVLLRKNRKNEVEAAGLRASHIRDAVALCQLLMKMEQEISSGSSTWTEMKAVTILDNLRAKQYLSMGPSFGTISAFGKHAAMPHYEPTPKSNSIIDKTQLYMVDSGGQYLGNYPNKFQSIWISFNCHNFQQMEQQTSQELSILGNLGK